MSTEPVDVKALAADIEAKLTKALDRPLTLNERAWARDRLVALLAEVDRREQENEQLWAAIHVKNRDIDASEEDRRAAEAEVVRLRRVVNEAAIPALEAAQAHAAGLVMDGAEDQAVARKLASMVSLSLAICRGVAAAGSPAEGDDDHIGQFDGTLADGLAEEET